MKTFKVLVVPCAIVLTMCLALAAQEPQGRGGQGVRPADTHGEWPACNPTEKQRDIRNDNENQDQSRSTA